MLCKNGWKKFVMILIFIILVLIIIIGLLKVTLNRNMAQAEIIADEYLYEKYGIEARLERTNYVFLDSAGYYLYYSAMDNDEIKFRVFMTGVVDPNIHDSYETEVFCWNLMQELNLKFSNELKQANSKLRVSIRQIKNVKNDAIEENISTVERQKEILYDIVIYTPSICQEKIDILCEKIKDAGYMPEEIRVREQK